MNFQLVPKSVTLNDHERYNGVILRYGISVNSGSYWAQCIKVHVRYLISSPNEFLYLVCYCHFTSVNMPRQRQRACTAFPCRICTGDCTMNQESISAMDANVGCMSNALT